MIKLILIISISLSYCTSCSAQVSVEWFRNYSAGWGKNFVNDFAIDNEGNTYLTGNVSQSASNQVTAFGTVKYNSSGQLLWAKTYMGSQTYSNAESNSVKLDNSGNVYITGTCTDADSSENYCTIKYNTAGDILWIKKYEAGTNTRDFAVAMVLDNDKNVYVTGYKYVSPYFWSTIKYDSLGNVQWVARYEGSLNAYKQPRAIIVDSEHNVYITGFTNEFSGPNFCTIKYNEAGQQQWVSIFNNPGVGDIPAQIEMDKLGNLYVVGKSFQSGSWDFYTTLIKYDSNGNELWHVMTDSIGTYHAYYYTRISFKLDNENNAYIATTYKQSCCTIKYNSSGQLQWMRKYNNIDTLYSRGLGIDIDNFGNIYTTGYARAGYSEIILVLKYSPAGNILWESSYHVTDAYEFDEGAFIGFDKMNNVYVAGNNDIKNSIKFFAMKFSQTIGISQINSEVSADYVLYQNYPNPFNPNTIINFHLPKSGMVSLKVYNAVGNEVITLINENKNSGNYNINFDGSNFPSGIYFYTLKSGSFKESKRMLLLK